MGLLCRTRKISEGITYTVIRDKQKEYEVTLSINNKTYETTKSLMTNIDKWVQQTIEDITGLNDETY